MAFDPKGTNTVVVVFDGMTLKNAKLNDDDIIQADELTKIVGTAQGALPVVKQTVEEQPVAEQNVEEQQVAEQNVDSYGGRRKKSAKRGRKPKRKKTAKRRK